MTPGPVRPRRTTLAELLQSRLEREQPLVAAAARAALAKKGEEPLVIEVGDVLAITDYFLVTSGTNPRQVATLAEEIERQVKLAGGAGPLRVEGLEDLRWVLLDFGEFVAHVFLDETRRYYELERLWGDVPRCVWSDAEAPSPAGAVPGAP